MACRLVFCALVLAGCDPQMPGEPVGTFEVAGQLVDNSCGPGVPAHDPLVFHVEVRDRDGQPFWWRRGEIPIEGRRGDDGSYVFRLRTSARPLMSNPQTGHPGCSLDTLEVVEVFVEALPDADGGVEEPPEVEGEDEVAAPPLEGDNVVEISPSPGSDCSPLLAVFGGPWSALPCRIEYRLEGTRRSAFD